MIYSSVTEVQVLILRFCFSSLCRENNYMLNWVFLLSKFWSNGEFIVEC